MAAPVQKPGSPAALSDDTNPIRSVPSKLEIAFLLILLTITIVRVVSTWHVFSETWDEHVHLACGVEWWDRHTWEYEKAHPPLARLFVAFGPWLDGARITGQPTMHTEGVAQLHDRGQYLRTLMLARAGVLPFLIIATLLCWWWSRSLWGPLAGAVAALLFTNLPGVLAHGGLATTDMAVATFLPLAVWRWVVLLQRQTLRNAVLCGLAVTAAILTKFSSFVFFPVCGGAALLLYLLSDRPLSLRALLSRLPSPRLVIVMAAVIFVSVWSLYFFALRPMATPADRPHFQIVKLEKWPLVYRTAQTILETPFPLSDIARGLMDIKAHNKAGHESFLLNQFQEQGWWYFFPVVLGVKLPLGFLLLTLAGAVFLIRRYSFTKWQYLVPLASSASLLASVCLFTRINLGLRYILPIVPFLAVIASYGFVRLWKQGSATRLVAGALMLWVVAAAAIAHPDYLAYFNEAAGPHPENILVDSDLDWGQDLFRLQETLRQKNIDRFHIAYFGDAALDRFGFPQFRTLKPYEYAEGWVVLSLSQKQLKGRLAQQRTGRSCPGFDWLNRFQPVSRIGKSLLLYQVPKYDPAQNWGDCISGIAPGWDVQTASLTSDEPAR